MVQTPRQRPNDGFKLTETRVAYGFIERLRKHAGRQAFSGSECQSTIIGGLNLRGLTAWRWRPIRSSA